MSTTTRAVSVGASSIFCSEPRTPPHSCHCLSASEICSAIARLSSWRTLGLAQGPLHELARSRDEAAAVGLRVVQRTHERSVNAMNEEVRDKGLVGDVELPGDRARGDQLTEQRA